MDFAQGSSHPANVGTEGQPANSRQSLSRPALVGTPDSHTLSRKKIWASRLRMALFVAFCIALGMLLVKLPWTLAWNQNLLLANFPGLRAVLGHNFVRGLSTGLGVVDIWIGVSTAAHYRDPR